MPNHCSSDLWVHGNANSLNKFMEFAKEEENDENGNYELTLSANKFIPYPQKYAEMDEKAQKARKNGDYGFTDGFNSGGYEWCCENWGTKWGIYNASLKQNKTSLKYRFESAWVPPLPVIEAMSKQFPELKFTIKFYERGQEFKGVRVYKGGKCLESSDGVYKGSRGG